ncbi:winged helix domain-containing protein [Agrobacterium deltaense]|uniref:winged helix domain-containing protein n=1 Tax=Agrobacterium deltaense TaxID=1183412 RepID=UPI003D9777EF
MTSLKHGWQQGRTFADPTPAAGSESAVSRVHPKHQQRGTLMTSSGKAQQTIRVQILDDNNEPVGFPVTLRGRERWAMERLMAAGAAGVSSLDNIGPRTSHYIFKLRGYGFAIETQYEAHGGDFPGHHARYRLHSAVSIVADAGRAAA